MKKLSLKNLKLESNDLLQRNQLKNVTGGKNWCYLTLSGASGTEYAWYGTTSTGAEASAGANDACVDLIINEGYSSCHYDCDYDGYGQ